MLIQAALTLFALAPAFQTQLGPVREAGGLVRVSSNRLWVVGPAGSGADFTDIQSAIDAAESGDAIEVMFGAYPGFVWEGKDLVLYGSGTGLLMPRIRSEVVIRGIAAGDAAVLRNLFFQWGTSSAQLFVSLESSPGTIWLENVSLEANDSDVDIIQVQDCENVVFLRSISKEGSNFNFAEDVPTAPRVALRVVSSTVHVYESMFQGPNGGTRQEYSPVFPIIVPVANQQGGHGAVLESSAVLFATGSEFRGGIGGFSWMGCTGFIGGCIFNCVPAEIGGTGLILDDSSMVSSLDSDFIAGPGRPAFAATCCSSPTPCGTAGPAGVPLSGEGTVTTIPLPARTYQVDGPVQAGGSYHLKAVGQPGEFLFSVFSERPDGIAFPIYFGTQLLAYPTTFVDEGPLPASGVLEKDVPIPPLLLGTFDVTYFQGLLFDALANAYLTSGSVLIVR